jgi:uncharacterized protein (DUF58 family)
MFPTDFVNETPDDRSHRRLVGRAFVIAADLVGDVESYCPLSVLSFAFVAFLAGIFNWVGGVPDAMQAGRRYWEMGAVGAFLAILAFVLGDTTLLFAAAGVAGLLVSRQFSFLRAASDARSNLAVEQNLERDAVYVDEPVAVTLRASLVEESPLDIRVESSAPAGGRTVADARPTLRLGRGETAASGEYALELASAGEYELERASVELTDALGLFREEIRLGTTPAVVAEPRRPRDVHVGQGGKQNATTYGAHESDQRGEGIDFGTLRQYVTGDPVRRIDWKATARLGEPYVQEQDTESNRETTLLFDHRNALSRGPPGERKIDYLRVTALSILKSARDYDDPVGLYAAGDAGITTSVEPALGEYDELRRILQRLEPTAPTDESRKRTIRPVGTRRALDHLLQDQGPYASTLRPYFEETDRYVVEFDDYPLLGASRAMLAVPGELDWCVVFTDDTDREEILEAVSRLRRGESWVTVFLAPSVFFDPDGIADFDRAYSRYVEFEEFRRRLANLNRVSAFEVGPGDRVEAILGDSADRARVRT